MTDRDKQIGRAIMDGVFSGLFGETSSEWRAKITSSTPRDVIFSLEILAWRIGNGSVTEDESEGAPKELSKAVVYMREVLEAIQTACDELDLNAPKHPAVLRARDLLRPFSGMPPRNLTQVEGQAVDQGMARRLEVSETMNDCPRANMSKRFLEMIKKAAAEANAQITAVQRGEYRPKIEVITAKSDVRQAVPIED